MAILRAIKEDEAGKQERLTNMLLARQFILYNPKRVCPLRFPHEELPGLPWGSSATFPERYTLQVQNAVFELGPKRYRISATPGFVHVERIA